MLNYLKLFPAWLFEVIRGNPRRAVRWHSPTPLLVIGHRGSPCFAIENTMASFQRAVEQDGANGLECDLCLTQDEQIVRPRSWDRPLYAFRGGLRGAGASSTDAKIAANIERGF
jgi:hypothetical protein